MYAVIKTGGKQYRVSAGDRLRVESIAAEEGSSVNLDQVLMVGEGSNVSIGEPMVSSASVMATVISHGRGKKVDIIKFRRRKHHRKQMGHRQNYTELEITGITGGPGGASSTAPARSEASPNADETAAKAAADAAAQQKADELASRENDAQNAVVETAAVAAAATGTLKFLDGPEGEKDDLKKISGVGPVLEEKLNGLGIYHFHQIAAFTQDNIDAVNTELDFPGRIERDEWITQAQELAKG